MSLFICILVWAEGRKRNPVKWDLAYSTGCRSQVLYCLSHVATRNLHLEPWKLRHMFSLGLGRRTEKIMKMFALDAHKYSRQVMYFEDILNNINILIHVLESNPYLPYRLKHELVTLSLSLAQQREGYCNSISWHRYRA